MIDIIGQLLLKDLQKINRFKSAVIAGGMVRDSHLGGDWKDIDIFTPVSVTLGDIYNLEKINLVPKGGSYAAEKYGSRSDYKVYNFTYHDTIPVQIIYSRQYDPSISYGEDLIQRFNYGIDQAYWDGEKEGSTEQFKSDVKYGYATLIKLNYLTELPKAIEKFNRLKEKYPQLAFSSTVLEIVKPRESKRQDQTLKYYREIVDNLAQIPVVPMRVRDNLNPAAEQLIPVRQLVGNWFDEPGVILEENFNRNP